MSRLASSIFSMLIGAFPGNQASFSPQPASSPFSSWAAGAFSSSFCLPPSAPFLRRASNLSSTFWSSSCFFSSNFLWMAVMSLGTLFFSISCSLLRASRFFSLVISLVKMSVMMSFSFFCIVQRDSHSSRMVTVPSWSPMAAYFPPTIWLPEPLQLILMQVRGASETLWEKAISFCRQQQSQTSSHPSLRVRKKAPTLVGEKQPSLRQLEWYLVLTSGVLRSSIHILALQSPTDMNTFENCRLRVIEQMGPRCLLSRPSLQLISTGFFSFLLAMMMVPCSVPITNLLVVQGLFSRVVAPTCTSFPSELKSVICRDSTLSSLSFRVSQKWAYPSVETDTHSKPVLVICHWK